MKPGCIEEKRERGVFILIDLFFLPVILLGLLGFFFPRFFFFW